MFSISGFHETRRPLHKRVMFKRSLGFAQTRNHYLHLALPRLKLNQTRLVTNIWGAAIRHD